MSGKANVTLKLKAVYKSAKRRALKRLRRAPDLGWKPPASRCELHER